MQYSICPIFVKAYFLSTCVDLPSYWYSHIVYEGIHINNLCTDSNVNTIQKPSWRMKLEVTSMLTEARTCLPNKYI